MDEQHILKTRRNYNRWVANQTMEDYALRFTAKSARQWSSFRVANTALGAISFLALEAIGGALMLKFGFSNAMAAILVVSAIIFICGAPVSYYAARYGVDIDLLTRGAGFGYIGSTITSLIYASFTFIFFAIEAAIMGSALELLFSIPLSIGYLISAVVVIPLVTHGITFISRFQLWSQPIWVILQLLPFAFILWHESSNINQWTQFQGHQQQSPGFDLHLFGAASGVLFSLMAQIGEQVDFLRFMPEKNKHNRVKWWAALLSAGPGWIVVGALKILVGCFLVVLALNAGVEDEVAGDPIQMYQVAFSYVTSSPLVALSLAGIFVIVCQLKINVTNAYAGSIAWSNFFSRLTHSHPGRVVWLVFNVVIALLIIELGIYSAIENILGIYSNVAVAWVGALVADLIINKPLGYSPKHIEFKRAHLFDINPVGVGSMVIASSLGIFCYTGQLGDTVQALAPFIALVVAFVSSPMIAFLTKGRYYLARDNELALAQHGDCRVCQNHFEVEDLAYCPAYGGAICSLCCTLDARCQDQCKPHASFGQQLSQFVKLILPSSISSMMNTRLLQFSGFMIIIGGLISGLFYLVYLGVPISELEARELISTTLSHVFFLLMIIVGVLVWLFVLANDSRQLAFTESLRQTELLSQEISAHEITDQALQQAKETAELANQAKSRYLTGISHELRTPLNSVLGYAQLLENAPNLLPAHAAKISRIKRSGEHLADIIEGLLDISRIEAGKLEIQRDKVAINELLDDLVEMFSLQTKEKDISFNYQPSPYLPNFVYADETHLRQILINLLSNAVKFTQQGGVSFSVHYRSQVAEFTIQDSGPGIEKSDQARIFKPFKRVRKLDTPQPPGTGLGLTITQLLTDIMGGNISLTSTMGKGSCFKLSLMLSSIENEGPSQIPQTKVKSYKGPSKTLMIVDDDSNHRNLVSELLSPLGFVVKEASDAIDCLGNPQLGDIDLFLLDISMPEMNGWQLLEKLRDKGLDVPIIMVSADAYDAPLLEHSQRQLHNDYLAKPIRDNVLLDKIANALKVKWTYHDTYKRSPKIIPPIEASTVSLSQEQRKQLKEIWEMAQLGFVHGIDKILTNLECDPSLLVHTPTLRKNLEQYQFSKIRDYCEKVLAT